LERRIPHVFRILIWLLAGLAFLVAGAWWFARPPIPDTFYQPPTDRPSRPGALLRQEPFARRVPADAQAWRILYTTTRADGTAAVASAIVMLARASSRESRPVIAWTHGTTGVAQGCAPSLLDDPFAHVPALRQLLDEGWVFVATDYVGLGTEGPHPFLIGEGVARSTLDAVRAVGELGEIRVRNETVVWGHSQGGHAALWTGIIAPAYASDVNLVGIAAVSPASDLPPLMDAVQATTVGRIMSSFVLRSYAATYRDVAFEAYVPWTRRWMARDMAGRCLAGREALFSVAEALLIGDRIFGAEPTGGPFGARLVENTPNRPVQTRLLIAQGLADDLIRPDIQSEFVRARCAAGQRLQYRTYAELDHLSVVAPDSPLTSELVQWTRDRFRQVPFRANCDELAVGRSAEAGVPAHHRSVKASAES
jgi:pimeloyl-ACP methyl ester carboxylesterase